MIRVAVVLAALAAAFCLLWLGRHPFTDEGSVCHFAMKLLDGQVLYSQVWNEKTPLHFVLVAGWFALAGTSVTSLRVLAAIELFVVLLLLYRLGAAARWLAVAAALLVGPWYHAHHGLQEATLAPLALAVVWLSTRNTAAAWGAAGALAATGVWVKQNFFAIFGALFDRRPRAMVWTWGAALAMSLTWLAALYLHAGDGLWLMPPFGEREAALPYVTWSLSEDKVQLLLHVAGVLTVLLAAYSMTSDVLTRRLALAALVMAFPALLRVGTHRAWPSAVLAIAATARLIAALPLPMRTAATAAGAAFVLGLGGLRLWINDWTYDDFARVAVRVAQATPAGEPIFVGPHEPLIYCMAGRLSPTRYDFALPWGPSPAARRELLADLTAAPPRVIVDVSDVFESVQGRLSESLPGIEALLEQRYLPPEKIAGFGIYVRAETPAPGRPTARPSPVP